MRHAKPGASSRVGLPPSAVQAHAGSMEVSSKPQLKPGQLVALLNAPPGLVLPEVVVAATPADADSFVAFVVRQDDLASAEQVAAARADRLAWIGYPKGGSSEQTSTATGSSRRWRAIACSPSARCRSMTPGPRCASARRSSESRAMPSPVPLRASRQVRGAPGPW